MLSPDILSLLVAFFVVVVAVVLVLRSRQPKAEEFRLDNLFVELVEIVIAARKIYGERQEVVEYVLNLISDRYPDIDEASVLRDIEKVFDLLDVTFEAAQDLVGGEK